MQLPVNFLKKNCFSEAAAVTNVTSSVRGPDADGISFNLVKPRLHTLMKKEHCYDLH